MQETNNVGISWRPITAGNVPAWNDLLAAAEAVDRTGEHYDEGDLHEELADPLTGPEDRVAGWLVGDLVAFAAVRPRQAITDHWRIDGEGVVAPEHRGRGIGGSGVEWLRDRARKLQSERHPDVETRLQVGGHLDNAAQVDLLESADLTAVNWSATMRAQLDQIDDTGAVTWPAGLELRTYDRSLTAATMAAHNAAFADHWGFIPWTPAMWEQWVDGTRNARHDQSWVVVPSDHPQVGTDDVVGYLLTSEFVAYQDATGRREAYLAKIGVRREHRGRGIASGLLRHALGSYRAAGFDESSLDVDTHNATGAYGLYERAGFRVESRTATFQEILAPSAG